MKSTLNVFITFLLFALTAAASAAPVKLRWNLCKGATLENRDGRQYLRIVVRPEDKGAQNCANVKIDLAPYANNLLEFTIRVRAKAVSKPAHAHNGVKFMLNYTNASGKEYWNNVANLDGTFDWKEISFQASIVGKPGKKSLLLLGLQESSGEVEFDLSSLQISPVFTAPSEPYTAVYSDAVASAPRLRGVMSPYRFKEEDFDTLAQWNVNLVRAQMTRNWGKAGSDRDLAEFDSWLDDLLAHYETMFPIGYEKGIRFIIDLHTPPGGRYANREMVMFHEQEYADHFVEVWKKIATRFKDNPAVWGYDLINEPIQIRRAPYDYWNLQRRAAEAIREIDPERPIIIESNNSDSPETFSFLAPVKLKNVIYQVHMYTPGAYTHQRVLRPNGGKLEPGEKPISYPGRISGRNYNKGELRHDLAPVREFQKKYGARIYVGEFSAIIWAPGAANYLRDCIEIFEEYGWDWSYHAFREWSGWSVEHVGTNREDIRPAPDTDRKRVLLEGFRKNRTN